MLEHEKPYAPPTIPISGDKIGISKKQYDNDKVVEKTETASNYIPICAPVSPQSMDIIDKETTENQSHLQPVSTVVKNDNTEKETSKPSSISIAEETYHASRAQVSWADLSTRNTEYGNAVPTRLENAAIRTETVKAHVYIRNSTLENIPEEIEEVPEAIEKSRIKESSTGFKQLLKFGRKSHSSATAGHNTKSDNMSIDGSEADEIGPNSSSSEVHTLKDLISQDETPATSTTQQKSCSFALLSSFRSKK